MGLIMAEENEEVKEAEGRMGAAAETETKEREF